VARLGGELRGDYDGLAAHGHVPHLVTAAAAVTGPLTAGGRAVTELELRRTRPGEAARLRRLLAALAADVLVVDMPRDLRVGALATAGTRTRLVNRYNRNSAPPPTDLLTRLAYRWRVAETVFLTAGGLESVLATAPFMRRAPARAIPNGIDTARYYPDAAAGARYRDAHELGDRPLLLAVGALTHQKRYDVILRAAAALAAPRPALHVCGEGPLEAEQRAHAAALGVEVRFVGQLAPDALRGAYAAATVFVHACVGETFGRSIGEAMACGCAVIVPDSGAAPEVVGASGVAGVVVAPADPAALAGAAAALLADGARRAALGAAARLRVASEFSMAAMWAGYAAMAREVAGRAGRPRGSLRARQRGVRRACRLPVAPRYERRADVLAVAERQQPERKVGVAGVIRAQALAGRRVRGEERRVVRPELRHEPRRRIGPGLPREEELEQDLEAAPRRGLRRLAEPAGECVASRPA
jgi:glycosyltransferase involved in cell wall biosynthesis